MAKITIMSRNERCDKVCVYTLTNDTPFEEVFETFRKDVFPSSEKFVKITSRPSKLDGWRLYDLTLTEKGFGDHIIPIRMKIERD